MLKAKKKEEVKSEYHGLEQEDVYTSHVKMCFGKTGYIMYKYEIFKISLGSWIF